MRLNSFGRKVSFSWQDVWQQEHQAAFTVAKAMQLDILRDIREAVDSALADGTTFETFRQNLKPLLVQKGWWGKADLTDPFTGEVKKVQLGSTRRLKTIYDTNLRTAHSEGQWTRIQHSSWDNLVLPVDDPFWQAHLPVKAWGCKCGVVQMDRDMIEQSGLQVGESPDVPNYIFTNKRTGEIQRIPLGVDPSFNYPPGGRLANLEKMLADKIDALPDDLKDVAWESEF